VLLVALLSENDPAEFINTERRFNEFFSLAARTETEGKTRASIKPRLILLDVDLAEYLRQRPVRLA
jgi:hypothetical protein